MIGSIKKYIHESNLVEGFDDPVADATSFEAWTFLRSALQPTHKGLTNAIICEVQKRITSFQEEPDVLLWAGTYRDRGRISVTIDGKMMTAPTLVPAAMDNWLASLPTMTPKEAHVAFERIHPFIDGNGRTGRMLMWIMEDKLGQKATMIKKSEVEDYYAWFA